MKINIHLWCSLMLGCFASTLSAQDAVYSQFYASPVLSNPAMAGYGICGGRLTMQYRNQWPSLGVSFQTSSFTYDQKMGDRQGAYGFAVMNDVAGDGLLRTLSMSGIYNYTIVLNRSWQINTALQGTFVQRSIDFNKLKFADQIEPKKGFVKPTQETLPFEKITLPSVSAGALISGHGFYAGVSVFHINEPYQSFWGNTGAGTYLPRRMNVQAGLSIQVGNPHQQDKSRQLTLSPNVLLAVQEKFTQLNLGFYASKGGLVTGVWFRQTSSNPDALICILGWQGEHYKFGYSYDITVSDARSAVKGSHEFSAAYVFCLNRSAKPPKHREICPGF